MRADKIVAVENTHGDTCNVFCGGGRFVVNRTADDVTAGVDEVLDSDEPRTVDLDDPRIKRLLEQHLAAHQALAAERDRPVWGSTDGSVPDDDERDVLCMTIPEILDSLVVRENLLAATAAAAFSRGEDARFGPEIADIARWIGRARLVITTLDDRIKKRDAVHEQSVAEEPRTGPVTHKVMMSVDYLVENLEARKALLDRKVGNGRVTLEDETAIDIAGWLGQAAQSIRELAAD